MQINADNLEIRGTEYLSLRQAIVWKGECRMEQIRKMVGRAYRFINSLKKHNYRNYAIIVLSAAVAAVVSLNTVGFAGSGKNKVYAAQTPGDRQTEPETDETEVAKLQAGLMGIVNSVNSMEEYSLAASSVDMENVYEEILVGTSKVRKNTLNKAVLGESASQISSVGYFAQQTVRNNHMASEDYNSLLQIVEAEATGGDIKSKILIANVVLNRVNDDHFPDTIYDVVWERRGGAAQFSPTADGRIYSVPITSDTYDAVDRALEGEDYSEGALFFMARASADTHNLEWFDENLELMFEYGGHEYYKYMD